MRRDFGTELNGTSQKHVAPNVVIARHIVARIGLANMCGEGTSGLVTSKDEVVVTMSIIRKSSVIGVGCYLDRGS